MFEMGDKVRIKDDAFPGSDDPEDVAARGKVGIIICCIDEKDDLWNVEVNGYLSWVLGSEIEAVEVTRR